jgi:hypothetical protein
MSCPKFGDLPGRGAKDGAKYGSKRGSGLSGEMSAESATRRAVRQLLGRRWHTLVSCTLTTEYRPVRPLGDGMGGLLVALRNGTLTTGNIFQFVMT